MTDTPRPDDEHLSSADVDEALDALSADDGTPSTTTDGTGRARDRLAAFARDFETPPAERSGGQATTTRPAAPVREEQASPHGGGPSDDGRQPGASADGAPTSSADRDGADRAGRPRDEPSREGEGPAPDASGSRNHRPASEGSGRTDDEQGRAATAPSAGPDATASSSREPADAERTRAPVTELRPGDVYRIVDGKEERDSPWARFLARTRGLFTSSPAQEEERLGHELEELRLRGLSQGVTVALGSIKGGAGKTTLTLTLAEVLANALRVGVLVVDADLEFGTASDSVPDASRNGGTLMDVHRARHEIETPGDLAPYLVTLPSGAQLLAGPTDPADIEQIDTDTMGELLALLRRFYPVILIDLPPGMGLRGSVPRWGFAEADDIVLVTTPKRANVKQMGHMLDYVSERHHEVPLTLAINMVPSRVDEAGQRVIGIAESNGRTRRCAEIPNDPLLARQLDAGTLDVGALDQRTRIAVKDLTVALATGWCR
jgi:MinD-like ATPase involved in chromosome partitioning or flagellar assembly